MKFKKKKVLPQPKTLRLQDNHTWKAPDGYKIAMLDRGAVSFNIPESWVVGSLEPTFELNDLPPPDDNARISVSFWHLPKGVDWSGLPLVPMLNEGLKDTDHDILEQGEITRSSRTDLEMIWIERRFMDPEEHREAFTRHLLARGFDVQAFISCDFWVDDAEKIRPVWDEVMRSLQLGRTIADPTRGVVLH